LVGVRALALVRTSRWAPVLYCDRLI
jgi:hypothetical protein